MRMLIDPYVYILRHEIPIWLCGRFYDEEHPDAFEPGVMVPFYQLEDELRRALEGKGDILSGPYWQTDTSIVHELLLVLLDEGWTAGFNHDDLVRIRPAGGEIFETIDHVFFVRYRHLTLLQNEVVLEIVSNHHGDRVGSLDHYLREGLQHHLATLARPSELAVVSAMDRLQEIPPRQWSWEMIHHSTRLQAGGKQ
jgi:hypothetical protein